MHANSSEDSIVRLETLASMSDVAIPFEALREQINSAIDLIVQLQRFPDGRRRVVEIAAVASQRREGFQLATVTAFRADAIERDRPVTGSFEHRPLPPPVRQRLEHAAQEIPREFAEVAG